MSEVTVTSADGTKLAARRSGGGSPLVVVHGACGDLESYALVEGLLAEQHEVWVFSRRGRGGSGDGPDYSLDREIEDIAAVVDAAGGDVHLLGHSSGGLYCLLAGERLASLRSLIVYEPPLRLDRSEPGVMERVAAAVGADDPDGALDAFLPLAGISPGEIQFMRSMEPVWSRLCAGVRVLPRESEALAAEAGRFATLKRPDVPMLYLYGSETDAPIFPTIKEVGELFPEAQLCGLAGQRHVAQAFDPAGFAEAVLRFTAAHDG